MWKYLITKGKMDIKSISPIIDKMLAPTVKGMLGPSRKTEPPIENELSHRIEFTADKEMKETIIKVMDDNGEIILVIPLEHMADISQLENSIGSILNKTL
jgi:hypothetical protein